MGMMAKSAKLVSLLKLIKLTKVILTASTMALSAVIYGWTYGPAFGVGLVAMLFVHEMGHVIAMRRVGMKTSAPVFIPFLGAVIFAPPMKDRAIEAYVGYGGPFLGSLGALVCMAAWAVTGSSILLLTAFVGIYINLLNMIPISPLDGGRIGQIVGPHVIYVGMVALVALTLFSGEPGMMLIWILSLQEVRWRVWVRPLIASVMLIVMTVLFSYGYGAQPMFIDALDVVVAFAMVVMYYSLDISWHLSLTGHGLDPATPRYTIDLPSRPYPPARIRYTWLAIYAGSVTVLWTTMWYLVSQMPLPR